MFTYTDPQKCECIVCGKIFLKKHASKATCSLACASARERHRNQEYRDEAKKLADGIIAGRIPMSILNRKGEVVRQKVKKRLKQAWSYS